MKIKFFLHTFSVNHTNKNLYQMATSKYIWIQTEKRNCMGYLEGTLSVQSNSAGLSIQGWKNYKYKQL